MLEGNITFYNKVLNAEMQREREIKRKQNPVEKVKKTYRQKLYWIVTNFSSL